MDGMQAEVSKTTPWFTVEQTLCIHFEIQVKEGICKTGLQIREGSQETNFLTILIESEEKTWYMSTKAAKMFYFFFRRTLCQAL